MAVSQGFVDLLQEILVPLGAVSVRRMFGGAGLHCDGVMFALLSDDALYLKADETTRPAFEAEGLGPFGYATKDGDRVLTSYWRAPERLLDEPEECVHWARQALGVARRRAAEKAKPAPRKRRRSPGKM